MARPDDPRFTPGLLIDVQMLLEQHGYKAHPDVRSNSYTLVALLHLVEAFEGKNLGDEGDMSSD